MPRFLQAVRSIAAGRAARTVVEEAPPTACSAAMKSCLASFLGDKSRSEIIFLGSVLLAVLLFAIVLPAYEMLFCDRDDPSPSPRAPTASSPGVHKRGVGIADVEVEGVPEAASASCGSSARSSMRSGGSCCTLETIEEEEHEFEEEDENENAVEEKGGESSGAI